MELTREQYHKNLSALNDALYPAMVAFAAKGITSPKPIFPENLPHIGDLCRYDDWELDSILTIDVEDGNDLVDLNAEKGTATLRVMRYGKVYVSYPESSDGRRAAGGGDVMKWYVRDTMDVTEKYQAEIQRFQTAWDEDQVRTATERAWNREVSDVSDWLRASEDAEIKKYHAAVETWETESIQNFMESRGINLDLDPGYILVQDNPYEQYPGRAGLNLLEYILKTFG